MLGRDAQRLAQPQRPGFGRAGLARGPLGLVGGQDDVLGALAQDVGEILVRRRDAHAGVDDEQADVGLVHGTLGQAPHPALQRIVLDHFQAGRVDHDEAQVAQARVALAQVAGDARLVIDQRQPLAHEAVEQGGLADIGPSDDGECEGHYLYA